MQLPNRRKKTMQLPSRRQNAMQLPSSGRTNPPDRWDSSMLLFLCDRQYRPNWGNALQLPSRRQNAMQLTSSKRANPPDRRDSFMFLFLHDRQYRIRYSLRRWCISRIIIEICSWYSLERWHISRTIHEICSSHWNIIGISIGSILGILVCRSCRGICVNI